MCSLHQSMHHWSLFLSSCCYSAPIQFILVTNFHSHLHHIMLQVAEWQSNISCCHKRETRMYLIVVKLIKGQMWKFLLNFCFLVAVLYLLFSWEKDSFIFSFLVLKQKQRLWDDGKPTRNLLYNILLLILQAYK